MGSYAALRRWAYLRTLKPTAWWVFAIQSFIALLLFWQVWMPAQSMVFSDEGDGLKNLFTLHSYLHDAPEDMWRYEAMNHPYGEVLWFTDATPLLALLMRSLASPGVPVEGLSGPLFHILLLLGIGWSSGLLFALMKRAGCGVWVAIGMSLLIPWTSPQLLRLTAGHFNLSSGWVILLMWWLLMNWETLQGKQRWIGVLGIVLAGVLISATHLYFLPMLGLIAGAWLILSAWQHRQDRAATLTRASLAVLIPLLMAATMLGWIRYTDPWLDIRPETAQGYNWSVWNLNPDGLWSAYDHLSFPGVPGFSGLLNLEQHVYLGGFVLCTWVFFLLWKLASWVSQRVPQLARLSRPQWFGALIFTGMACLVMSLGEYVRSFGSQVNFDNWLHPFKLIGLFTEEVTQFRCLGRFAWPFFWSATISAACLWDRMWKSSTSWRRYALLILLLPCLIDTVDQIRFLKERLRPNPLATSAISMAIPPVDSGEYQAILPLPFYHVGSETMDLTLDPAIAWEKVCLQAALYHDLPLISSKMSRTPPAFARSLLEWIGGGNAPTTLDDRPILVMYSLEESHWADIPPAERMTAQRALLWGKEIPLAWSLLPLGSDGKVSWYRLVQDP